MKVLQTPTLTSHQHQCAACGAILEIEATDLLKTGNNKWCEFCCAHCRGPIYIHVNTLPKDWKLNA